MSADCDLLVVGAGAAGMTAALVGALEGLRVVLCESSQQVGGTSATSAGTLWIPGNRQDPQTGHAEAAAAAARYLDALIGADDPRGTRSAFLQSGPEAIDYLAQRSQVRFLNAGRHPDYVVLPDAAESGRALSPVPFDGRELGADFHRIRPPIPEFLVLGGMMVGKADIQTLVRRWQSPSAMVGTAKLVLRYVADRLRHPRGTRLVMGNALVGRLFASLRDAGVDLRFGWALEDLHVVGGRVAGAWFEHDGRRSSVSSGRGVVLATGGIGHDQALMRELGAGAVADRVLACDSVQGGGIRAARGAGVPLEQHPRGNFFWQPVSAVPRHQGGKGLFPHLFLDRAKPGLIAVDERGRRFANEAASYHHFAEALVAHREASGTRHCWLVCDADFVRRFGLGVIPPGTRNLARWAAKGYIEIAATLAELAGRAGIDADSLAATVVRSNAAAPSGRDPDFHKGEAPVDRFNGDPAHSPNPCLGTIGQPPYVALRVHPGVAAASAGLPTDADARVLRADGAAIEGLYACGNDAASLMRGTYPGPGITLGPGMVFAYRAARHAAASDRNPGHPARQENDAGDTSSNRNLQHV